jgi:hypothetical protein
MLRARMQAAEAEDAISDEDDEEEDEDEDQEGNGGNDNNEQLGNGPAFTLPTSQTLDDCVVCFERAAVIVVQPCLHLVVCEVCEALIPECPICRGTKENVLRIYKP